MIRLMIAVAISFCLFGPWSIAATTDNKSAQDVEIRGVINTKMVVARSKPDQKSKRVKTLWRGAKVVVLSAKGDWYKIKTNNVRTGYILKKYVDFKSTLKKENKRVSPQLRKARLDIKSLINRFNVNMNESMFFEKEGIIPYVEYVQTKYTKSKVSVELRYMGKNSKGPGNEIDQANPFNGMMKSLMEVVFFKMMIVQADTYEISIETYDYTEDNKKLKPYSVLTFQSESSSFDSLKNDSGKIWEYIQSSKPTSELFVTYQ